MRFLPSSGSASAALSATVLAGCAAVMLAALLSGCASEPKLTFDRDAAVDLKRYKTFGYFDKSATDAAGYSTLLSGHLKRAPRAALEKHGYSYAAESPDLRVNFFVTQADKQELRATPGMGRLGYRTWSGSSYDLVEYRHGTLRIDLVDARRNAVVWQGIAEGRIGDQQSRNPGGAIDAVVARIFARFPDSPDK